MIQLPFLSCEIKNPTGKQNHQQNKAFRRHIEVNHRPQSTQTASNKSIKRTSIKLNLIYGKDQQAGEIDVIGGSDINGNRGYYLGTGLFWDANKVIGPEADLSFSSVGDENGISTSFLSSEQELNLTVWAHLNLVRKAHHKLSLEIGPSIGSNWSITKREIQRKNSTPYYNLKAGFSYTYFMFNGDGIGLKSAISLYESAYIAFRYLKKF